MRICPGHISCALGNHHEDAPGEGYGEQLRDWTQQGHSGHNEADRQEAQYPEHSSIDAMGREKSVCMQVKLCLMMISDALTFRQFRVCKYTLLFVC